MIFETVSKLLLDDLLLVDQPPYWKISDVIPPLRKEFSDHPSWSINWVPRKLNHQAHLLAQWAARSHVTSFLYSNFVPLHILLCDSNSIF